MLETCRNYHNDLFSGSGYIPHALHTLPPSSNIPQPPSPLHTSSLQRKLLLGMKISSRHVNYSGPGQFYLTIIKSLLIYKNFICCTRLRGKKEGFLYKRYFNEGSRETADLYSFTSTHIDNRRVSHEATDYVILSSAAYA